MAGYTFSYIDPSSFEYALVDNVRAYLMLDGMTGFGMLPISPASAQRPYRPGHILTGKHHTGPRVMGLWLSVIHDSHADLVAYLRALARNASPHKDPDTLGKVKVVTPDSLTRYIDCWMMEFPDPAFDGPVTADIALTFWAANPFFYNPTQQSTTIGLGSAGGVTFPANFVDPTGVAFGSSTLDDTVVVNNAGDVETWPTIRINGPGNNPTIVNNTSSKTMAITQVLDAGDYITINMDAATITFWDDSAQTSTNIIANMSAASVFFPLERGANSLRVTMTNVTTGSIVVSWYDYYQTGL